MNISHWEDKMILAIEEDLNQTDQAELVLQISKDENLTEV